MGTPDITLRISVSSAKLVNMCQKKYYIEKVLNIVPPEAPHFFIGKVFAKLTEAIAKRMPFEHILQKSEVVACLYDKNIDWFQENVTKTSQAEMELNFEISLILQFLGYIDAIFFEEKRILIRDFKTASDFKWSLDEIGLSSDEQLNIYGYFIDKYHNPKRLPIWIEQQQFHKTSHKRRQVQVPYCADTGKQTYDWMIMQADKIREVLGMDLEDVPKNTKSCGAFGGCKNRPYCEGGMTIEELEDMFNDAIKKRSKQEIKEMKPEERLEETKQEINFNKGAKMSLEKLKAIREKQKALAQQKNGVFDEPKKEEVGVVGEPRKELEITKVVEGVKVVEEVKGVEEPKKEEPKVKEARKKKAKVEDVEIPAPGTITEMPSKESEFRIVKNAVLVLVGCSILEEAKNHPSDFLHDVYIKPVLENERIPHIACSEFSKANKLVLLQASSILEHIVSKFDVINIDLRRPVDALVYQMIMDMDVKKDGEKRFRLVRSTF